MVEGAPESDHVSSPHSGRGWCLKFGKRLQIFLTGDTEHSITGSDDLGGDDTFQHFNPTFGSISFHQLSVDIFTGLGFNNEVQYFSDDV